MHNPAESPKQGPLSPDRAIFPLESEEAKAGLSAAEKELQDLKVAQRELSEGFDLAHLEQVENQVYRLRNPDNDGLTPAEQKELAGMSAKLREFRRQFVQEYVEEEVRYMQEHFETITLAGLEW
jgi:hypothetical protein